MQNTSCNRNLNRIFEKTVLNGQVVRIKKKWSFEKPPYYLNHRSLGNYETARINLESKQKKNLITKEHDRKLIFLERWFV